MASIINLPKDVLTLIISYIKLRSHLWSVVRSCKSLYEVTIPAFYRHLVIQQSDNMLPLAAALNPENAGLQHVRHLTLVPKGAHFRYDPATELDLIFSMSTNMLPRDRLLTFTFDCPTRLDRKLLEIFHQRQRHLRTMRVSQAYEGARKVDQLPAHDPAINYLVDQPAHIDSQFDYRSVETGRLLITNVTCLNIQVHCKTTEAVGQKMIENLRSTLLHLEVSFGLSEYCRTVGLNSIDASDRSSAGQNIIKSLFSHVLYVVQPKQHRLRTLHLQQVPLSDLAASKLTAAVDLSRVHSLVLQRCDNPAALLRKIRPTGCPARIDMRSLVVTSTTYGVDDGIDDFLSSFGGLENLVIDTGGDDFAIPVLESIRSHARSLKTLYLEHPPPAGSEEDAVHYDCDELQDFLSQCKNLEQLALHTPSFYLDLCSTEIRSHVKAFAGALAAAPALRTFRSLTVPGEGEEDFGLDLSDNAASRIFLTNAMQKWASQYLDMAPQITALSMCHGREKFRMVQDILLKPGFYCRGQITKPYGRTEAMALEMPQEEVREVEPVSEILTLDVRDDQLLRSGYER